jgi:acetate kinase
VDRILGYVGAYFVALDGAVDALVFAGGIGEKSVPLRAAVAARTRCLGFAAVEDARNADVGGGDEAEESAVVRISGDDAEGQAGREVLVCRTDEQYEMARECVLEDQFWK